MRLLILFISFLISGIANGQILNASAPYRVRSGCATKLLDAYSGASVAYSLRKLDADYAGSAIRVRRSSDNTEQDIGFVGCGDLDTAALKTFVGTGGTDDGFVVTWYSQTGSYNVTQATSADQPRVMNDGVVIRNGGNVAIEFFGGQYLESSTGTGITTLATHSEFLVYKGNSATNNEGVFVYRPSSGNDYNRDDAFEIDMSGTGNNFSAWGGSGSAYQINVAGSKSLYQLITHIISSGSGEAWQNGSSVGTDSYGSFTAPSGYILIGGRYLGLVSTSYRLNGYVHEIIAYDSDQTANRTGIQTNINAYWQVY